MATQLKRNPDGRYSTMPPTQAGVCFTISPHRFEEILRTGKLPKDFSWKLKKGEQVESLLFDEHGITVFVDKLRV